MRIKNGFSLVEVIIAITIIGVVGLMTTTIMSRSYRVNNQSSKISLLKQNGDMALGVITETLRNAEGVVCYSGASNIKSLVVRTLAGKYVKFRFVDPSPPTGTPTQNGFIVKQENLNPADFDNFCTTTLLSPAEVPITNKDENSGVSISNGTFSALVGSGGKDLITIKFNVYPSLRSSGNLSSDVFPVQTTIQIR